MIPVIDLFAGAGGFGIASRIVGGDLRLSVEIDHWACETLRLNDAGNGHVVHEGSVLNLTGQGLRQMAGLTPSDPLVVVGGAPCQPFSKNAYWRDSGEDLRLRLAFYRGRRQRLSTSAAHHGGPVPTSGGICFLSSPVLQLRRRPDGFVLENVPSISHPRNRQTLQVFIDTLKADGMEISVFKGNSAQFGVPQKRERVFIFGTRSRILEGPDVTHAEEPSIFLPPFVTVGRSDRPLRRRSVL